MEKNQRNRAVHKWSQRDGNIALGWCFLVFAGAFYRPLLVVAFGLAVGFLAWLAVRQLLRQRRWRENPPGEFWIERVKD